MSNFDFDYLLMAIIFGLFLKMFLRVNRNNDSKAIRIFAIIFSIFIIVLLGFFLLL